MMEFRLGWPTTRPCGTTIAAVYRDGKLAQKQPSQEETMFSSPSTNPSRASVRAMLAGIRSKHAWTQGVCIELLIFEPVVTCSLRRRVAATVWKAQMLPYKGKATLVAPSVPQGDEGATWLSDFVKACPKAECGWNALNLHCEIDCLTSVQANRTYKGTKEHIRSSTLNSTSPTLTIIRPMATQIFGLASSRRLRVLMRRRRNSIKMPKPGWTANRSSRVSIPLSRSRFSADADLSGYAAFMAEELAPGGSLNSVGQAYAG